MGRLVCWLRGHRWGPYGYRLAYVPGGHRYVERCARCGEERTRRVRLERAGMDPPDDAVDPLAGMPESEERNWLDMADAVLAYISSDPVDRLNELGRDWLLYTTQLGGDPAWRDEMRRAVVVELQVEVAKLAKECGL